MMAPVRLLLTCEHGGYRVPRCYRALLAASEPMLRTHRGYDAGALALARTIAARLGAPLIASTTTRLLADLNRAPGHRGVHGEAVRQAPVAVRRAIVARYHRPYRDRVESCIRHLHAQGGRVVHVSVHSFTPVLDGRVRATDIGLLYDPARPVERRLCARWRQRLRAAFPGLVIRRNDPYRGVSDGMCTAMRKRFADPAYAGVELEINQKHVHAGRRPWRAFREAVTITLAAALDVEERHRKEE